MRSEWNLYKIGELCDTISDTYNRSDDMVILINTSDVLAGKIINHNLVSNKNLKGQFKKTFRKNDILYSEIRPINKRFAFIDFEDTEKYIASTKLMVLRSHKDIILPYFLFTLLQLQDMINKLQHLAETRSGTFPQITFLGELAPIEVKIPDLNTQSKIVSILMSIDTKISLNNAINKNLEEQAQALFKAWFVDFEPFGGVMPNGTKMIPLNELCVVVTKGTTPTTLGKAFTDKGINFIKAESIQDNHSFDRGKFAHIDTETNNALKRSIIKDGDILFSIAGTLGRFALVDNTVLPANTNQAVAVIRVNTELISSEYLYSFFVGNWHNDYYKKRIQQAVQANLSLTAIKSLPIAVLPNDIMIRYNSLIAPYFNAIKANEYENQRLASLRDTLLPKLMNGEIDVSAVKV